MLYFKFFTNKDTLHFTKGNLGDDRYKVKYSYSRVMRYGFHRFAARRLSADARAEISYLYSRRAISHASSAPSHLPPPLSLLSLLSSLFSSLPHNPHLCFSGLNTQILSSLVVVESQRRNPSHPYRPLSRLSNPRASTCGCLPLGASFSASLSPLWPPSPLSPYLPLRSGQRPPPPQ